jgi:hypothetical protein
VLRASHSSTAEGFGHFVREVFLSVYWRVFGVVGAHGYKEVGVCISGGGSVLHKQSRIAHSCSCLLTRACQWGCIYACKASKRNGCMPPTLMFAC